MYAYYKIEHNISYLLGQNRALHIMLFTQNFNRVRNIKIHLTLKKKSIDPKITKMIDDVIEENARTMPSDIIVTTVKTDCIIFPFNRNVFEKITMTRFNGQSI